ncbi:hypothetical protein IW261DRAFT_1428753 [Armillaria novae-zelandiae]|uniref:Uncharacterized protein n=1 Tax=Armillaria novae-zelandiae TaxID=153914 RepID=A0AA39N860_9AGAR|nr:hypothetical protein IW261DRAFT_1428753 [Armillaria novae-zelandiae]
MTKKAKQPSAFDASSVRFCPECRRDVRIAFGGEKNWAVHLKSHEHLNSTVLRKSATITSFFKTQNPLQNIGFVASVSHVNLIAGSETAGGDMGTMNNGDKTLLLPQTVIEMEEFAPAGETIGSQLRGLHTACKRKLPGSSEVFEGAEIASCGEYELSLDESMDWIECSGPACFIKYHSHCQGLLEKPPSHVGHFISATPLRETIVLFGAGRQPKQ